MSSIPPLEDARHRGLLPFQAQFVAEFLTPDSPPHWELIAPPGTGKSYLARVLVERIRAQSEASRILVLTPRALVRQWADRIPGSAAFDRGDLLEYQAQAHQRVASDWPQEQCVIMSIDLAKRLEAMSLLQAVSWTLVIADESPLISGKRAEAFYALVRSGAAARSLLIGASAVARQPPPEEGRVRRVVTSAQVIDWSGAPLYSAVRLPEIIPYVRNDREVNLIEAIQRLTAALKLHGSRLKLQSDLILRATSSSLFTAEPMLRRLSKVLRGIGNKAAHGLELDERDFALFEEFLDDGEEPLSTPGLNQAHSLELRALAEELIDRLDSEAHGDTKVEALQRHLLHEFALNRATRVCIATGFAATAQYLTIALESIGVVVVGVTGQDSRDSVSRAVDRLRYATDGGIIITTGAATEEETMDFIDQSIHYDLPATREALEQRYARFLQHRRTPFRSWVLWDTRRALVWEETLFDRLGLRRP